MADLSDFMPNLDDLVVTLVHPNEEERTVLLNADGSEMTITIMSKESDEFKDGFYQIAQERNGKEEDERMTFGESKATMARFYARLVVSCNMTLAGELVDNDFETLVTILTRLPWITAQIRMASEASSAFT